MVRYSMSQETEAIRVIGEILSNLEDPASRARVLRWAAERFELTSYAVSLVAQPVQRASDPMLSIDELAEFFPASGCSDEDDSIGDILTPVPMLPADPEQLGPLVHSFVSEFQLLAAEWQIAFGPMEPDAPAH
jgi:hypothetical protein